MIATILTEEDFGPLYAAHLAGARWTIFGQSIELSGRTGVRAIAAIDVPRFQPSPRWGQAWNAGEGHPCV
jgi:hypothetical protein